MDDSSGWNEVLLGVWHQGVRDAVVARIEAATIGRRGWLVRVFATPDAARADWTETVHAVVLAAIRDETGADLDELGSQAAWECYEQVWECLRERWGDGGDLATVRLGAEPEVTRLMSSLPAEAAACAGADVTTATPDPLWLRGRLRVDAQGLGAYLILEGGTAPRSVHAAVTTILSRLEP